MTDQEPPSARVSPTALCPRAPITSQFVEPLSFGCHHWLPDDRSADGRARAQFFCDYAWLGGEMVTSGVTLDVNGATIEAVGVVDRPPAGAKHLAGLTLPGLANAHSHAFHRALRGRSEKGQGSFWTWRDMMYSLADVLTPEQYFALARAVYAEMAVAGFTIVGEFHYLHHAPGGVRYGDPNVMGRAVLAAAREAGVKVVLLDTCYLEAGPGRALEGAQLRFGDGDVEAWAARAGELADMTNPAPTAAASATSAPQGCALVGAAIHSVRAVPPSAAMRVAEWAADRSVPLHFHCSEQPAENNTALAVYGATPVQLLAGAGALRPGFGRGTRHSSGRGGRRSAGGVEDQRVHVPDDGARSWRWDRPRPASPFPRRTAGARQRQPRRDRPV